MPVLYELENRPTLFKHKTHTYTGWAVGSASDLGSLTERRGRDKRWDKKPQPWGMPKGWYWIISLLLNRKNTNCLTLRSNNTSNNKTYNIYFISNNNRQNDKTSPPARLLHPNDHRPPPSANINWLNFGKRLEHRTGPLYDRPVRCKRRSNTK